ncbi:TPA: hypothetical protein HA241_02450 [Candidatus Woesearchaeota archaeon]|nr:hypothetical protein [Candidatus Woesearchaeota archaeon]
MTELSLDTIIGGEARVLELVRTLGLLSVPLQREYEATLSNQRARDLIAAEDDLGPVRRKLTGKRGVSLTERQQEIVVVVASLHDFEEAVEPYLRNPTDQSYAIEHILAKSNPALARRLDFDGLQILRRYTQFSTELEKMYAQPPKRRQVVFSRSADDVATMLVGRTLTFPAEALSSTPAINAWEAFLKGRNNGYTPVRAVVLETEGFETNDDVTPSRYCMLAAPGQIDTMPHRGQIFFNIGTSKVGVPSCVMVRAISIDETVIDGPGKVGAALYADYLKGKFLGKDIPLEGITRPSGYIPGHNYSTGRHRVQFL